ncbi:MAG: hypothetical protein AAGA93_19530 [Actinomycetota bacterium]
MTRTVILERAYEMYLARELIHGDERLSLVLDSLGYTTGAGYQIWPNQAAFRLDLQVYIAERIDFASLEPLVDELQQIRDADYPVEEHILRIAELYHDYFIGREEFYLVLRFFAMGGDRPPEVTEALRDSYVRQGWELDLALQAAMERRNYRLRAGRSMEELTTSITALVEGYALRHRVGPDAPLVEIGGQTWQPFSAGLLSIIGCAIEPADG